VLAVCGASLAAVLFKRARSNDVHKRNRHEEKRKSFRNMKTATESRMVLNNVSKVVHWPTPGLFKYRQSLPKGDRIEFSPEEWRVHLGAMADVFYIRRGRGEPPSLHFIAKHQTLIREVLALNAIRANGDNFEGIDEALQILKPTLLAREPGDGMRRRVHLKLRSTRKQNFRVFDLYAKLACLQNAADPNTAYAVVIDGFKPAGGPFGLRPSLGDQLFATRNSIQWPGGWNGFVRFHKKAIEVHSKHRTFRKRLACRILEAKRVVGEGSSSGKDTRQREGSSNLPPNSLHCHNRKRSLGTIITKRIRKVARNLRKRFGSPHSRRQR